MNIIIIANGQFPTSQAVLCLLDSADLIVCCDGAFENYFEWSQHHGGSQKKVVLVGDGDSVTTDALDDARWLGMDFDYKLVSEQESNDLTKAVRYVVEQFADEVSGEDELVVDILGATGLREDHTLGNISLLAYYTTQYPNASFRMVSDYGVFLPMQGCQCFASYAGQQVSLFSFTPDVPVSVKGLRYPIENRKLTWLWEGTLNEAMGDRFEVRGGLLVVYLEGEPSAKPADIIS